MTFISFFVLTALCLVFPPTRAYGVIGTGLSLYLFPVLTLAVLAVAGIAYYFYRRTIA